MSSILSKEKSPENEKSCNDILKREMVAVKRPFDENIFKQSLVPSLKYISAVKIIIPFWSQANVPYYIKNLPKFSDRGWHFSRKKEIFKQERNKILRMVLKLCEFHTIRQILSDLVDHTGQEIFDWIEYHDRCVFYNSLQGVESYAVHLLDSLVWTSKGIIDYKETAKVILAENRLSDINNCFLACTYCFEHYIAIIKPEVYYRMHCSLCYSINCSKSFFNQTMAYFWAAHLTGDFSELSEEVNFYNECYETNYNIYECVLRILAIHSRHRKNKVAITYVLNKLSDKERSRQIVSLTVYNISDANLMCFFLSQMNKVQQGQVFKARAINVLLSFLDNWSWIDHFLPIIHRMWDIISGMDYLGVVTYIVSHRMEKHINNEKYYRYRTILEELWESAPKHLKEFLFEFKNGSEVSDIFFGLLCKRNLKTIQMMLLSISDKQKESMIFSCLGNYHRCYWLIVNDQLDVVEIFINNALSSDEDVDMFKRKLVGGYGRDIAVHFIQNQEWAKAEQFMQWALKSDDDVKKFKRKLVCSKISDDILESIVADDEAKFVELEHFLNWCATDDAEKVIKLKMKIPQLYFNKVICNLIKDDNYQLLGNILNWCYSNDQHEIDLFKLNFYQNNDVFVLELLRNLVEKNDELESLQMFVGWCFSNEKEISRFKEWILQSGRKEAEAACLLLLYKDMWESADEFIHWCCDSSQLQITEFKNELLLSYDTEIFFARCTEDEILNVLEWFRIPSDTTLHKIQFTEWYKHYHKQDY